MTFKRKVQIIIDLIMTAMLPFLMAYNMIGDAEHEWIGLAIFALFILHHILNFRFTASAAKGKYTPARILLTVTDILLFIDMLCLMVSSVILSRHVFAFLGINSGASIARTLHLLGSYWGFVLMSIHLGLHCGQLSGMLRKAFGITKQARPRTAALCISVLLVSAYGLYEFFARKLPNYMFLKTQFVFFDYSEPLVCVLASYVAILVLFAAVGYAFFRLIVYFSVRLRTVRVT